MLKVKLVDSAMGCNQVGLQIVQLRLAEPGIFAHVWQDFPPVFGVDFCRRYALVT
jgi:hypothetical protein